jgi:glycosyltransferase involved in cell wall biosynthesis
MLFFRKRKSVLFVRPDYHSSFAQRESLRSIGWKSDIYVPWEYPETLLFSKDDIKRPYRINIINSKKFEYIINQILADLWFLLNASRYKFHFYYGRPPQWFNLVDHILGINKKSFCTSLFITGILKIRILYLPTGCHDEESKEQFLKLDEGKVCGSCGAFNNCKDSLNLINFKKVRRYSNFNIGTGTVYSTKFNMIHLRFKSIYLNKWNPNISIPDEYLLPPSTGVRILHSSFLSKSNRDWQGRNIKGSGYIKDAIEKLIEEGYECEHIYISGIPSHVMRYYQAQADIVVDQLIYGWWGSTTVEALALGKPVICYLRKEWKQNFLDTFPEYDELPIAEANPSTIYTVLKDLVDNQQKREELGRAARKFAEKHFDPNLNMLKITEVLTEK